MSKFLDYNGLLYYDKELRKKFDKKVDAVTGKGLSTNDLTNELKANYDAAYTHSQQPHAPANAERNTIVGIKVNGVAQSPDEERNVNLTVPTGALANKSEVTFDDLDDALSSRIESLESGTVEVDDALSDTSTNPVQNKVVKAALDGKAASNHTHDVATTSENGFMSSADKQKLDGIANNANNYVHPSHDAHAAGLYKVTVDDEGHVTAATAVAKTDITALGIPAQDTTYSDVTAGGASGLMSGADKTKLDGIEAGANKYVHPAHTAYGSGLYKVTVDEEGHVSAATAVEKADITNLGIPAQDTTYQVATTGADGLMSSTDKSKLDAIPTPGNIATTESVASAIAAAGHIKKQIVEELPEAGAAQDNVIYLVPKTSNADGNVYDEYWLIDGELERIGDTATKIEAISNGDIDTIMATE